MDGPAIDLQVNPVPTPLTAMIGRERETSELSALLMRDGVRPVTLTGPGAVGKTRLSIAIAQQVVNAESFDTAFVPLASIDDAQSVIPAFASALGNRESASSTVPILAAILRDKRLLLRLDNFEHGANAAPSDVDLLAACPSLKLLVTRWEALKVQGEHEHPIAPLSVAASESSAVLSRYARSEIRGSFGAGRKLPQTTRRARRNAIREASDPQDIVHK